MELFRSSGSGNDRFRSVRADANTDVDGILVDEARGETENGGRRRRRCRRRRTRPEDRAGTGFGASKTNRSPEKSVPIRRPSRMSSASTTTTTTTTAAAVLWLAAVVSLGAGGCRTAAALSMTAARRSHAKTIGAGAAITPPARCRIARFKAAATTTTTTALRSSSSSSSDDDGFFEAGGDMDRLVRELSETQQLMREGTAVGRRAAVGSTIPGRPGWLDASGLPSSPSSSSPASGGGGAHPSPVEVRTIRGREVHVKHDDQLRLAGSGISGNKARKMWTLNGIPAAGGFPRCLVSHGGPQSNSMLALAAVASYKNRELQPRPPSSAGSENDEQPRVRFVYYAKKLPRFLRKQPNGNLFRALSLGMELVEVSREDYKAMFETSPESGGAGAAAIGIDGIPPSGLEAPVPGASLWVPQGGAFPPAREGARRLAREIRDYWSSSSERSDRPLTVVVPGGTCTTAVLLHHGLKELRKRDEEEEERPLDDDDDDGYDDYDGGFASPRRRRPALDIEVVVVPCVGDAAYARRQMMSLAARIGAPPEDVPTVLPPDTDDGDDDAFRSRRRRYFTFGKPDKTVLETFRELSDDHNLVVDLIYGAPSFAILWRHWGRRGGGADSDDDNNDGSPSSSSSSLSPDLTFDPNRPLEGREIMYVHSGGLEGINSQLLRYKYEGLVEIGDVQLPGRPGGKSGKKKKQQRRQRQQQQEPSSSPSPSRRTAPKRKGR